MAKTTAPKTAPAKTAPKTAKATRPEPVHFDLDEFVRRTYKSGTTYQKACNFDHATTAVTAYCHVWDDGECTRAISWQTYNGMITGYQADAVLTLTGGIAVADLSRYLGNLDKKGYTPVTATKKTRKTKGGA